MCIFSYFNSYDEIVHVNIDPKISVHVGTSQEKLAELDLSSPARSGVFFPENSGVSSFTEWNVCSPLCTDNRVLSNLFHSEVSSPVDAGVLIDLDYDIPAPENAGVPTVLSTLDVLPSEYAGVSPDMRDFKVLPPLSASVPMELKSDVPAPENAGVPNVLCTLDVLPYENAGVFPIPMNSKVPVVPPLGAD